MAIVNPQNFEIPTEDLTIATVAYYLDSVSPSDNITEIDVVNSAGEYVDSAYAQGKQTCSFTIRKIKNTDALPAKFATFEYDGATYRIKTITPSKSNGQVTSYTIECDKVVTEPAA